MNNLRFAGPLLAEKGFPQWATTTDFPYTDRQTLDEFLKFGSL
jgi:hypothetical protein